MGLLPGGERPTLFGRVGFTLHFTKVNSLDLYDENSPLNLIVRCKILREVNCNFSDSRVNCCEMKSNFCILVSLGVCWTAVDRLLFTE